MYILNDDLAFDVMRVEEEGLERWAVYLSEKDWVTDEDIGCFVRLVLIMRGTKAVYEVVRALPPKERAKILEALGKTLSRADTAN